MGNKRILYLYTGNHPVHKKFAESIGADIRELSWNIPKGYDIYFTEGAYVLPVLLRKIGRINKKAKIIVLFADPRLYYLDKKIKFSYKNNKIYSMSSLRQRISRMALRKLNGAICEGEVNFELFKKFCPNTPVKKIIPFIWDKRFKELIKVRPNLKTKNILFVGNGPDEYCKGLGLLIKIFKGLRKKDRKLKLNILGENWDIKKEWIGDGIYFKGKRDIVPFLEKSSLLVHLGQGEGFGIQILESLLAGIPTIVSEGTGAKEIVREINSDFVVSLNEKRALDAIKNYFHLTINEKKKLSVKGRKIVKTITRQKQVKFFKKQFDKLVKEVYDENFNNK